MNELENLQKQIEGIQAKIQVQKCKNQKLQNELNNYTMEKDVESKEVSRLKDKNISLQNQVKESQRSIKEIDRERQKQEGIKTLLEGIDWK